VVDRADEDFPGVEPVLLPVVPGEEVEVVVELSAVPEVTVDPL